MKRISVSALSGSVFLVFIAKCIHLMHKAGAAPVVTHRNTDLYEYFVPYFMFAQQSIRGGTLPLWTPHQAVGSPVFAAIQVGLLYPLNWTIMIFDVPTAMGITQILNILVGLTGMTLYLRHLKLEWPAVMLGAVLFGFAVFTTSYHQAAGSTFCWTPIMFWLSHRIVERPSFAASASLTVALALSFFGGNTQYFYYASVILAIYVLLLVFFSRGEHGIKGSFFRYGTFVSAFVLMIGLVSIQVFPTLELAQNSIRNLSRTFPGGTPFGRLSSLSDFFISWLDGTDGDIYFGSSLLLLCFAIGSRKRNRIALILSIALLYAMLFAMSKEIPLLAIFGKLPLSDSFRYPTRMMIMSLFLVPALVAVGLSSLWDRGPLEIWNSSVRRLNRFWILFFIFSFAVLYIVYQISIGIDSGFSFHPLVLLICLLLFLLLLSLADRLADRKKTACTWLIAALLVSDVFLNIRAVPPVPAFTDSGTTRVFDEQLEWIRTQAGFYRVLVIPHGFGCYNPNVGTAFQFSNINSYETFTLARWRNFLQRAMTSPDLDDANYTFNGIISTSHLEALVGRADMAGLTSLRYLVVFESRAAEIIRDLIDKNRLSWKQIGENSEVVPRIYVYENELALPRAYMVGNYRSADNESASLEMIEQNSSLLSSAVVLEGGAPSFAPTASAGDPGRIEIISYGANKVELRADANGPSLAVLTDAYYPGWIAFVDGVEKPIWRANSLFRAVEVPSGRHTIVFRYEPVSLRLGKVISLLTIAVIVIGLSIERRYKKNRQKEHNNGSKQGEH
jgi:hypothetical protein